MENNQLRRIDDSFIGKALKIWPFLFGVFGVLYAIITNYNMVKANTEGIYKLSGIVEGLSVRTATIEKDMAVKSSQFTVILSRTDRIEDKLDKLIVRR